MHCSKFIFDYSASPSQALTLLPNNLVEGELVLSNENLLVSAGESISGLFRAYYMKDLIVSNIKESGRESITKSSRKKIADVIETWDRCVRICPVSEWNELKPAASQPCILCFKQSYYFNNTRLCLGEYCLTDWLFKTKREVGMDRRCRACFCVIENCGELCGGRSACVIYFLRVFRIITAYGSFFWWIEK